MRRDIILILDDDPQITSSLALGLERDERVLITCNEAECAKLIIEKFSVACVVSDISLTGPFDFEGLDLVRYVARTSPRTRVVLMTGAPSPELQNEAEKRGVTAFLHKPFELSALEEILDSIPALHEPETRLSGVHELPSLDQIISGDGLVPHFQPIVALAASSEWFGFESLARFRTSTLFANPALLFQYAERKGRLVDLELACIRRTFKVGAELTRLGRLFLNVHPAVFAAGESLMRTMEAALQSTGVEPARIVLEITEQGSLHNDESTLQTIDALRALGFAFAFDDVGVAYSHLPHIGRIKPAFLKISQDFGTGFENDPAKERIVRHLSALATAFECDLILEGIENRETADVAIKMGIRLGQGYYFSRPLHVDSILEAASMTAPLPGVTS